MPLFKVETRTKSKSADKPARKPARSGGGQDTGGGGSGAGMAIAAGALIGIMIVVGIAAFMLAQSGSDQASVVQPGTEGEAVTVPEGAPGLAGASEPVVDSGVPIAVPTPMAGPINADYPRDHVVAVVNGEQYTMGELETAVRTAQVLGALSGDAVPAYDSPEMPAFQVRMLRRQVDMMLMRQAAAEAGLVPPPGSEDELVDAFLFRLGSTRGQLEQLMTAHGVTKEQLDAWFAASTEINSFVQQELMLGQDQELRNEITQAWLDEQWATQQVLVDFYDPDTLLYGAGAAAEPGADSGSGSAEDNGSEGGVAP